MVEKFYHCNDIFMKANDLAWQPGLSEAEYEKRMHLNKMDLILNFDSHGQIDGSYVHVNEDIKKNDEVGITYGYDYWK